VQISTLRGHSLIVLSQGSSPESFVELLGGIADAGALGLGLARRGLEGARLSIGDAESALAVSLRRGRTSMFHRDWFWALTLQSDERLRDMLAVGARVAQGHPDLARTVETYAQASFSAAETARRLSIHLNTVIYRLDRWEKLTGWNPRTFEGLLASQASLV
jgi:sugar diacid utilization regulator